MSSREIRGLRRCVRFRAASRLSLAIALSAPAIAVAQPAPTTPPEHAEPTPPATPPAPASPPPTTEPPAEPPPAPVPEPPRASPAVAPPHVYTLESVEIRGNVRTRDRVILRYVPFRAGALIDVDDPEVELARYRLLGTGFFQSVSFTLRRGSHRGAAVLVIDVRERNTIVVNDIWLGLSATADDQGQARPLSAYGGADGAETNLAGTGITLGGAFALADGQIALRLRFLDPAFLGTSWMAQTTLLYNGAREFYGTRGVRYDDPNGGADRTLDFAVVSYKRFGGAIGAGRDLGISTQLWLDYRLERIQASLPLAASHYRGPDLEPLTYSLVPGKSVLSTVRATVTYDTRDAPLLSTKGYHLVMAGDVSLAPLGSSYAYEKMQVRASRWWPLPRGHVFRLELYGGAIGGDAPVFEKFYVADFTDLLPDRVLDLNTDRRPAPNFFATNIAEVRFGDYAAKVQGEYRIPVYRGSRSVYGIDFYAALGLYAVTTKRDIVDPARGYDGFARLPIDMTFNLGLRMDTKAGGFTLSFANPLGFVPILRGRH
jgi:outer membrane protein assembly factor BamA